MPEKREKRKIADSAEHDHYRLIRLVYIIYYISVFICIVEINIEKYAFVRQRDDRRERNRLIKDVLLVR